MGLTDHLDVFRAEVRRFIAARAPAYRQRSGVRSPENSAELADLQRWTQELYAAGYIGGDWPAEYGGAADHDVWRDLVVTEEFAEAEAPPPAGGSLLAARALIDFGTDVQRSEYLPRIRSGEHLWCQLFSEPSAGSDLAALRTRAELSLDGSEFVVNGQKVWTTNGQWADFGLLLARTDRKAPKHRGISVLIVDMSAPGVSVRPLREITGTSDFNEVFFDGVRVRADRMIGEPGQGWVIANATLAHERTAVGAMVVSLRKTCRRLASELGAVPDSVVMRELTILRADIEALSSLAQQVLSDWHAGTEEPDGSAIVKLVFSELNLRLSELGLRALGDAATAAEGDRATVDDGLWQDAWLYARAYTIAGGSSEIMRSLIAERGLGLPR